MINVLLAGSKGRMGGIIASMIEASNDLHLKARIDAGDRIEDAIAQVDAVVDFTAPDASARHAAIAAERKRPIVIGTTGLDEAQKRAVADASRVVPVVFSPNMSIGVNVMLKLVDVASRALGRRFRIDISETHHIHKKDRPSGTAKKVLDVALAGAGYSAKEDLAMHEEDIDRSSGKPVNVLSVRRGEVVGDHEIAFRGPSETLSISHHAEGREIFAAGALAAIRWIVGKPAGLYGMDDVLGLK